jgi:hypothetical protein
MRKTTIISIIFMAALTLAAFGAGSGEAAPESPRTVDESREAASTGAVSIKVYAGSVKVMGAEGNEVRVTGTLGRDIKRLDFTSSDDSTKIETIPPDRNRITSAMKLSCELEVTVPEGSSVQVASLGADVTVRDVKGEVKCDTLGGNIDISGAPGIISLRTLSGSISLRGPAQRVSFEAMGSGKTDDGMGGGVEPRPRGGGVTIEGNVPEVMGTTLGADVLIRGSSMKDYDLGTLSGTVTLDGILLKDGRLKVDAGLSGSIDITLPSDVQGKFTLNCPLSRIDMKGFAPKADLNWVFKDEGDARGRISVSGGAPGRVKVDIEAPDRTIGLPALPRISLEGSFNEFDVGAPETARVFLGVGLLEGRSSGSGIVLRTK